MIILANLKILYHQKISFSMQELRKNNPKHVDIIEELHTFDKNIIYLRKECNAIRSKA